jgi:hypothetical protein
LANQNINNFTHLFKNNQNSNINILWTLSLRQSVYGSNLKTDKDKSKIELMKEPSFYKEDLDKYIKKKMKKSKSAYDMELPSLSQNTHLFKKKISDKHGTNFNNKNLLFYELTLREHDLNESHKEFNKSKWNNNVYKEKDKDLIINNYNTIITSEKLRTTWLNEKLVNRPFKILFKKIQYKPNGNIILKNYIKDKDKAYNMLNDNYSLKPYNDKYTEKNYIKIKDLLRGNDKSQEQIWFKLNLRNHEKK